MDSGKAASASGDTSPLISDRSSCGSEMFQDLGDDLEISTTFSLPKSDIKINISAYEDDHPSPNTPSDEIIINKDNIDEYLPDTVSLLTNESGAKVYLVGTAHFSIESQNDVSKMIQAVEPHIVMVELCSSRLNILQLDEETILEEAKNINMEKILSTVRRNGMVNGLMYILLLNMSAHITKELGMAPGGEFRTAFKEAKKLPECAVYLGDRPINITLHRVLAALSWWQTMKLGWHLLTSRDPISKEDVEKCKRKDFLEELIGEMAGKYPALGEVFVNERDTYLTHSLQITSTPFRRPDGSIVIPRIVGVVGIGHVPGITRLWNEPQRDNVAKIMTVPAQSLTSRVLRLTIRLSVLGFIGYTGYKCVPAAVKLKTYLVNFVSSRHNY